MERKAQTAGRTMSGNSVSEGQPEEVTHDRPAASTAATPTMTRFRGAFDPCSGYRTNNMGLASSSTSSNWSMAGISTPGTIRDGVDNAIVSFSAYTYPTAP